MKTDLVDVNDTRKTLTVEIPSDIVNARIEHVAKDYSRKARIPGFRPGKVPSRVIKQRFKDQILHDVAHELVPRAIEEALGMRGVEPVDTPEVHDVVVEENKALTFTAQFDTVPPFEIGDVGGITIARPSSAVTGEAVDQALTRLRQRAARMEPVEGRGAIDGDIVTLHLDRTDAKGETDHHDDVNVEIGATANPPGFDAQILGLESGAEKNFSIHYPDDYQTKEMAGTDVSYHVKVNAIKKRVLPELDDEFAKDMGEFESLDALRTRVREDLEHEARHNSDHAVREELMKQLAAKIPFDVPPALIEREINRRLEEFAARLIDQNIDPRQAGVDWNAFRESQREVAKNAVASALALDEIARREQLSVSDEEIEQEIARYAERTGRTPAAIRAAIEKEGGLARVYTGLRREKSIDFVKSRAKISGD
ncbi:MAG: trigger factor [Acidobacteriaceae bacterium]|jgi:trigger factor|nr:trigger factor [Acidobacteriaceae bacterium]